MNIVGIIAEYNPFHNGHFYQIEQIRKTANADFVIAAMSGDFVQRGGPAAVDKYIRTHMALLSGVDLVLELPSVYSTASAELFAFGGVSLFHRIGIVNGLSYGCEANDLSMIRYAGSLFSQNPEEFANILKQELKKGLSFPAARNLAAVHYLKEHPESSLLAEGNPVARLEAVLNSPNNILAIEYEKAAAKLNSGLRSFPVLRTGTGYHDLDLSGSVCSASAIRNFLLQDSADSSMNQLTSYIPSKAAACLMQWLESNPVLSEQDFSRELEYCLLTNAASGFTNFSDCSEDISNRITNLLEEFEDFPSFCHALHTRDITFTRISRILTHILLNISNDIIKTAAEGVPYARILGFRKNARVLLSAMAESSQIPLLSSLAEDEKKLSANGRTVLSRDLFARDLYRHVLKNSGGIILPNSYRQSPVII